MGEFKVMVVKKNCYEEHAKLIFRHVEWEYVYILIESILSGRENFGKFMRLQ